MALGHEVKLFRLTRRMEFWSESLSHWAGMTKQPLPGIDQVVREASDWALIEAAYFRPDLVLIISGMGFHPNAAALLRQHGYRVAVVFTECPYDDDHHEAFAQVCDCVLVNDLSSVERLRAVNPRTWYLPTAYSEGRHYPQDPEGECDAIFVGTGFSERQALIEGSPAIFVDLVPADKERIFAISARIKALAASVYVAMVSDRALVAPGNGAALVGGA